MYDDCIDEVCRMKDNMYVNEPTDYDKLIGASCDLIDAIKHIDNHNCTESRIKIESSMCKIRDVRDKMLVLNVKNIKEDK